MTAPVHSTTVPTGNGVNWMQELIRDEKILSANMNF
jgi:hypothetical protein